MMKIYATFSYDSWDADESLDNRTILSNSASCLFYKTYSVLNFS